MGSNAVRCNRASDASPKFNFFNNLKIDCLPDVPKIIVVLHNQPAFRDQRTNLERDTHVIASFWCNPLRTKTTNKTQPIEIVTF